MHPHEIVTQAVWWWRRSPTCVAGLCRHFLRLFSETMYVPQYEITSVDLDYEDGRELLTTLGRTLSGIPDGPGRGGSPRNRPAAGRPWPTDGLVRARACARRVRIGVADRVKKFWGTRPRTCPGKVSVCSPGVSLISAQYPSAANLLSVGWEILGIGALSWTGVKVESTWTRSLLRLPRKAGMSVIKNFGTQGKG